MQTFMTDTYFAVVAQSLDNKRLGKQRVEAFQILNTLTGKSNGWANHPATKMWQGNEWQLANYGYEICQEWANRGFKDSLEERFWNFLSENRNLHKPKPWWAKNSLLQLTHQSNLMRKLPDFYRFKVPDNIPYIWPMIEGECFLMGTIRKGANTDMLKNGVVYLTSKQVAEVLGVSPKTISAYKNRGQMPAPDKQYGRTPLWKYSTILAWRDNIRTPLSAQQHYDEQQEAKGKQNG
jgi:predicted DNA-binding transcriptional regulator AlpA